MSSSPLTRAFLVAVCLGALALSGCGRRGPLESDTPPRPSAATSDGKAAPAAPPRKVTLLGDSTFLDPLL